jgi:DNA-binding MarR family transcriptional regulator
MNIIPKSDVPEHILKNSVLAHVAAAYFSVGKRLERKTRCSATRGFILSTLRDGVTLNQNQIATRLGLDRTVVHRAIKSMKQEGLVTERKAKSGRAIHVRITTKGAEYRQQLIEARMAADDAVRQQMTNAEREILLRLLKVVAECEF